MLEYYNKEKKIILMGSFPPPIGGVSIYLNRLFKLLAKNNYEVLKWDISKGRVHFYLDFIKYFTLLFFNRNYILHLHALNKKYLISSILLKYLTNVELYMTNHNIWFVESCSKKDLMLLKLLHKHLEKVIVVNSQIIDSYKKRGIIINAKIIVQNAFLPPPLEDEKIILDSYSDETLEFIKMRKPVIISNAFKISFYNNVDVYGLDMCVELTNLLIKKYPNLGFVFALADANSNLEYLNYIKAKINDYSLNNNFHFVTHQKEIWPLFKRVDIMIRPTYSDGYGISIDEALYFECKAIASDVCERAKGTVLFKNRDLEDLYNHVDEILANLEKQNLKGKK